MIITNAISEKAKRMIEDDSFFDVTEKEVSSLLVRLKQAGAANELIVKLRIKYDQFIDDKEKRLMDELGLDYQYHRITMTDAGVFYINGYTKQCWKMLTDDTYFPARSQISTFMNKCRRKKDWDALRLLETKYGFMYEQHEQEILLQHGLHPDTKYSEISSTHIDGLTFPVWKLVNINDYEPYSKSVLITIIRQLRKRGKIEVADIIEKKYDAFLNPPPLDEETLKEYEEGYNYFVFKFLGGEK